MWLTASSDSGKLTFLKKKKSNSVSGMAGVTSDQCTSNNVPLTALRKKSGVIHFYPIKICMGKSIMQVTFASIEFAMTNGDHSTELTESFLLVYRSNWILITASACCF